MSEATTAQPGQEQGSKDEHEFKLFHKRLCERFAYTHDEKDWRRDVVSLIEHIASRQDKLIQEKKQLVSALTDVMREVDETTVRNGWAGYGGRRKARDTLRAVEEHGQQLDIRFLARETVTLTPIPLRALPSLNGRWAKFQGVHLTGTAMGPTEAERVQAFMQRWSTEALFDGTQAVTLAGNMLALCDPGMCGT